MIVSTTKIYTLLAICVMRINQLDVLESIRIETKSRSHDTSLLGELNGDEENNQLAMINNQ